MAAALTRARLSAGPAAGGHAQLGFGKTVGVPVAGRHGSDLDVVAVDAVVLESPTHKPVSADRAHQTRAAMRLPLAGDAAATLRHASKADTCPFTALPTTRGPSSQHRHADRRTAPRRITMRRLSTAAVIMVP